MESSITVQRYAAEIYRLQEHYDYVPLSDVAEHVEVSLQAASRMTRRMKKAGLIEHEPYKGVLLTGEGEKVAMMGLRRHRLAEIYLVRVMGFGWEEVHNLTHDFEMGLAPAIEARISEMLGHPRYCPHGEPIPDEHGNLPPLDDMRLTEAPVDTDMIVSRVRTHDANKLAYFERLSLLPGASVRIVSRAPFDGPVRVGLGKWEEQVLGYQLAEVLWVRPKAPA